VIAATALLAAVGPAAAGDVEAGKKKAKACVTCHGRDGIGTAPHFPNLAGQKLIYLTQQMKAFRDGKRQSEVMGVVIKALSDADIDNLAAYYESLKPGCAQ
jgi:cytochrome c553